MASENQFIVDLGTMKLTEAQRASMNSAIHKAVAGELSGLGNADKVVLVPISKGKGLLINGIMIRQLNEKMFNEVTK